MYSPQQYVPFHTLHLIQIQSATLSAHKTRKLTLDWARRARMARMSAILPFAGSFLRIRHHGGWDDVNRIERESAIYRKGECILMTLLNLRRQAGTVDFFLLRLLIRFALIQYLQYNRPIQPTNRLISPLDCFFLNVNQGTSEGSRVK